MTRGMKAMVLTGHGGLDRYEWHEDWPAPVPGPMEALIEVGACGLNNTDVNTRTGWYSRTETGATTGDAPAELDAGDSGWGGRPIGFPRHPGRGCRGQRGRRGRGRRFRPGRQAGHGRRLAARPVGPREHGQGSLLRIGDRQRIRRVHEVRRAQSGGRRVRSERRRACDLLLLLHHGRRHAEPRMCGGRRHRAGPRRLGRGGGRVDPARETPRGAGESPWRPWPSTRTWRGSAPT